MLWRWPQSRHDYGNTSEKQMQSQAACQVGDLCEQVLANTQRSTGLRVGPSKDRSSEFVETFAVYGATAVVPHNTPCQCFTHGGVRAQPRAHM